MSGFSSTTWAATPSGGGLPTVQTPKLPTGLKEKIELGAVARADREKAIGRLQRICDGVCAKAEPPTDDEDAACITERAAVCDVSSAINQTSVLLA